MWFTQKDGLLTGTALDPNLLPANISGEVDSRKVEFHVDPDDGNGWAAAPTSRFRGRMPRQAAWRPPAANVWSAAGSAGRSRSGVGLGEGGA